MILGWREWVGLPDLGLARIKAKLDTGARTSSLHVSSVETFKRDGEEWVRFEVVPQLKHRRSKVRAEAPVLDERMVRDSGGHEELRVTISTTLEVAHWQWAVDVTLASRSGMKFRMLLGRQALGGRILVDPYRSYLAGRRKPGEEA